MERLLGNKVTPLKACTGEMDDCAKHAYLKFWHHFGERLERLAREKLGRYGGMRFLTYGNFEHVCCECRKYKDAADVNFAKKPAYQNSARFHDTLPYH